MERAGGSGRGCHPQGPGPREINVRANGTSDAITGASIHVTAVGLAIEALKAAR